MRNLERLADRASIRPRGDVPHEGECAGTLCKKCWHCMHSVMAADECPCDCTGEGTGCSGYALDEEDHFRLEVGALIEGVQEVLVNLAFYEGQPALSRMIANLLRENLLGKEET